MTININKSLVLLGFCILTTSLFAQTTTSSISVSTSKTKVVKTPLISINAKTNPIIISQGILNFVIEDDIMKQDDSENDESEQPEDANIDFNTIDDNDISDEGLGQIAPTEALQLKETINIFPLPAKDYFNISIENNSIENLTVVNANGQVVFNEVNTNQKNIMRIETNQLAKGIYFVMLNTSNGRISKSIIVQ